METPGSSQGLGKDLQRFEVLLDECERLQRTSLPFDTLRDLGRLYRRFAAELARLRQRQYDADAIRHLNALCVRAYTLLYGRHAAERGGVPWWTQVPRWLGQAWPALALSWALLAIGLLLGGVLSWRDSDALHLFVPPELGYDGTALDRLVTLPSARAEFLAREATPAGAKAMFGSYLFVHNTRIGLLALASGMLAGIPTMLLQLYNGMMLGAFASIFLHDAWPLPFLAWILPHAIPELTAISLCCAGGLLLGRAVALPGRGGHKAALRAALHPVLLVVGAAVPLFAAAALIEGFVRESALGSVTRLMIAAVMLASLAGLLQTARRLARRHTVDTSWLRAATVLGRGESPGSG
jgi:uncharacterized membrane protein SpoIIM required for sporulation